MRRGALDGAQGLLDERLLARLEKLALLSRTQASGLWAGERPGVRKTPSLETTDYRAFTHGDDLRWVDWNAYRRLGTPFIRLGPVPAGLPVYILLDCSQSMDLGEPNKLTCAKQIAAALGYLALRHLDPVAVHTISGQGVVRSGTWLQRNQTARLIQFLNGAQATGSAAGESWLRAVPRRPLRPGLVLVISDGFLEMAALDRLMLSLAAEGHRSLLLHLLSPDEIETSSDGDYEFEDAESARLCKVNVGPEVRARYKRVVAAWREELHGICRRRGAMFVPLSSGWSLEDILLQHLLRSQVLA